MSLVWRPTIQIEVKKHVRVLRAVYCCYISIVILREKALDTVSMFALVEYLCTVLCFHTYGSRLLEVTDAYIHTVVYIYIYT